MVNAETDARFMERALFLAERGRGTTTPNPRVGAVIVSPEAVVVGQGAHLVAGGAHAEVAALQAAGDLAWGATLYCTLEPCCHTGRTGPCVERIVPAGISRVVAAMRDPNPRVSGGGFSYLRAHGVDVTIGTLERAARLLNQPFLTWVTRRRPFVTLKAAVTRDGFVGQAGSRVALTGLPVDRYFHRQRAEVDAIAVGADTVLADDPLLTARLAWRARPLTRLVFDWRLRVAPTARLFSTRQSGPVIMAVERSSLRERPDAAAALERAGAEVAAFDTRDLRPVLDWMASRDVQSLLVEGGPRLHQAFFDAGLADRMQRIDTAGAIGAGVPVAAAFEPGQVPTAARVRTFAGDRLVEWDVHGTH